MNAAGFVLAGMRKIRSGAHSPMILAHSLTSDFFGIEERESYFPDFESFHVWPATARLLWQLREIDHLAGQSSLAHFGHWHDPARLSPSFALDRSGTGNKYGRKAGRFSAWRRDLRPQ
jgi:hypothetical protein